MNECRYHGQCRIEFDTDFDACYPCIGDWGDTCAEYEPMPDVNALLALADEMEGEKRDISCATCRADFGLACYDYKPNATCMEACLRYYARRIRKVLGVHDA